MVERRSEWTVLLGCLGMSLLIGAFALTLLVRVAM